MDGTTKLIRQLSRLMADVGGPTADLGRSLDGFVRALAVGIPSYCGLVVHLRRHGRTVTVNAFDSPGEQPVTSLRWVAEQGGADDETTLILYAHHPGAFVDLAADLGYVLDGPPHLQSPRRSEDLVRLDQDLPPPTLASSITGVEELAMINRATGVLIDRGTHPDDVVLELARQAAAAGLDHYTYARTLLGQVAKPPTG